MSSEQPEALVQRAAEAAAVLKAGTWEAVEALALLAVEAGSSEGAALYEKAVRTADGLKAGTWESVRALALVARAGRELGVR